MTADTKIIADAGSFGFADRWKLIARMFDAVITKTITPLPINGVPRAIYKVRGGWINAVGLHNPGLSSYIEDIYEEEDDITKIISIYADTVDEYIDMVKELDILRFDAIELNLSCPNVHNTITTPSDIADLLSEIADCTTHNIIIKISPYQDYIGIANAAGRLYAVHIANTQPVMFLQDDIFRVSGGLSGKCLKYAGLKAVYDLSQLGLGIPLIAGGGVYTRRDVKDYIALGASKVSVCSSVMWNPLRAWWLTRT